MNLRTIFQGPLSLISRRNIHQVGWVSGSFAADQGIRLVSNVILSRLLAPQLFGIMQIVNTLRTGVELLSEIGVSQNIVQNPEGEKPAFYNTAWTIQILRGICLFLLSVALAPLAADFYENDGLAEVIQVVALVFIITGFISPARYILQKRQAVATLGKNRLVIAVSQAVALIVLAWIWPTIWSLVIGMLFGTVVAAISSFYLMKTQGYRLMIDRQYLKQMLGFGKWLFLSTLFYFLATNFDRLYFAAEISFAALGIYGIARTLFEAFTLLFQRIGTFLIFPKVAAFQGERDALRTSIARVRFHGLLVIAAGLALFTSLSDLVIVILYDDRYIAGAVILPILLGGAWFAVLATMSESVMLGIGKPRHAALANGAKLVWLGLAVPFALIEYDIIIAFCAIALADLVRYAWLTVAQGVEKLSFGRQDIFLTLVLAAMIIGWRILFTYLGLVPDFEGWLAYADGLHG